ncbi:MAG: biopolymer transporter ExbD [Motiliproteus sp.]
MNLTLAEQVRLRRHRRSGLTTPLNLVALMDVFTILVFFFLAHSSSTALSAADQQIRLPESVAQQPPQPALVVTITTRQLLLEGQMVDTLAAVQASADSAIPALVQALAAELGVARGERSGSSRGESSESTTAANTQASTAGEILPRREVTIMADLSIPFRVIKKVMLSCQQAGYQQISLSVVQKSVAQRSGGTL